MGATWTNPLGIGVLFGCFARKNRWPWSTWCFSYLPGPSISPERTPMPLSICLRICLILPQGCGIKGLSQKWESLPSLYGGIVFGRPLLLYHRSGHFPQPCFPLLVVKGIIMIGHILFILSRGLEQMGRGSPKSFIFQGKSTNICTVI